MDKGVAHVPPGRGRRSLWVLGELVTYKIPSQQTGGAYALFEVATHPRAGAPPHVQHREDESFYVLEGEYEFLVEGRTISASAGSLLYVSKGTLHAHENVGEGVGRMLMSQTPGGLYEHFFEEVAKVGEGEAGTPVCEDRLEVRRMVEVAAAYGIEIPSLSARNAGLAKRDVGRRSRWVTVGQEAHPAPDDRPVGSMPPSSSGMRVRLELFVENMQATIDFYTRVLGFKVERDEPGEYASLRTGEVVLGIGPISKLSEQEGYFTKKIVSRRRGLGVEIVLEVDDVDEWHQRVLDSGYPVFEPLRARPWGSRDFRIVDPDGYYLRLTSRQVPR